MKKLEQILNNSSSTRPKRYHGYQQGSSDDCDVFDFLELIKKWPQIIGESLCKNTMPLKFSNSKLTIVTNHPIFSQQLSLMEKEIINNIQKIFSRQNIKVEKILFQTNPTLFSEFQEQGSKKKTNRDKAVPKVHPLNPKFNELQKKAAKTFEDLEDPELKNSLQSIFLQMANKKDPNL